ncbi:MAG: DUF1385 domain-containing protein [Fimbriimonas sp.]
MPKGEYLQYGGQAIVEGVMMRSPKFFSIACRAPNGEIVLTTEPLEKTWIGRQKWLKTPFLRGSWALLDAMTLGIKAMRFASEIQIAPAYQPEGEAKEKAQAEAQSKKVQDAAIGITMVISLALGLFLFNYIPNALAENTGRSLRLSGTGINFITEIVKIIFFLGYIALIGQMPDIKRVFQFHGAEHKAINVLEAEQELNMENCRAQTRLHPRCGTSFAIIVLILGIFVSTFTPRYLFVGPDGNWLIAVSLRFLLEVFVLLPIISGIAYELIRLAGKFRDTRLVNILFKPGLMSQYLTTREPDDSQIEVSLAALDACIHAEETGELRTANLAT